MFLEITNAEYIADYTIKLWFNNGDVMLADLADSLKGKAFEPLKDIDFFKRFRIHFNTIEWPNETDFAPEYLHTIAKMV